MKASGYFINSIKFTGILLFILFSISSRGRAQDIGVEQAPSKNTHMRAAMENREGLFMLTPGNSAIAAAVADGLTTNLALSAGAVETNALISTSPIGLLAVTGMKIGWVKYSEEFSEPDKRLIIKSTSALWGGAAVNNMAVYLAAPPPVPVIAGILIGIIAWLHVDGKYEKEDAMLALRQVHAPAPVESVAGLQGEIGSLSDPVPSDREWRAP